MRGKPSSYPIADRVEKIAENKFKLKGSDIFIWYFAIKPFIFLVVPFIVLMIIGIEHYTVEIILTLATLAVLTYYMLFRDLIYCRTRSLEVKGDNIFIGRRRYKRNELNFISITVGNAAKNGGVWWYRVNLKMKGWFFTNKCIMPIVKKEEAQKAAEVLAAYFNVQVWDETNGT